MRAVPRLPRWESAFLLALASAAAAGAQGTATITGTVRVAEAVPADVRQLVLVVTPGWDATSGVLRRYQRTGAAAPWRPVGDRVSVVVGRSGLAWGADSLGRPGDPHKAEGDGRAPAGVFPLTGAFGFAAAPAMTWVRLPYLPLVGGTECVDDTASAHYNTVVDRTRVDAVDWTSAERMREIGQYEVGVLVGYNAAPPRRGRGSCIFLHIWGGPGSTTAGCTAMPRPAVDGLLFWLDAARRPVLVQLPAAAYRRLRPAWRLP